MTDNRKVLFTSKRYREHTNFWKEKLASMDGGTLFRGSALWKSSGEKDFGSYEFELKDETRRVVSDLTSNQNVGVFVLLTAGLIYLLSKYCNRSVVSMKSPLLDGNSDGSTDAADVLLVERVDDSLTVREFLGNVRKTVSLSYKFQNFPLEWLLGPDEAKGKIGTNIFVNFPQIHRLPAGVENHDLVLEFCTEAETIRVQFSYNTEVFDEQFIVSFGDHYQNVLAAYGDLESKLSEIEVRSEDESRRLLFEFNDTVTDYPRDKTVHELFETQVEKSPDRVAVEFESTLLTYRELNEKSNQLAHYLKTACNVRANDLVGVMVNRSARMIIGLLGILKAGGAYVSIDPDFPQARIDYLLQNSNIKTLLTDSEMIWNLVEFEGQLVALDVMSETFGDAPAENQLSTSVAGSLIYVMYTSGSTGEPKGVAVEHRSVVRLVKNTNYINPNAADVFLQLAPISFDASTLEIWGSLLNGARLVVMPPRAPSLEELGESLRRYQVTTLWLTASMFHLMVDERLDDLRTIRHLLAGGDVLSVPHVRKVLQQIEGIRLTNGYGPTESTTFACCYSMTHGEQVGNTVLIGRPIANTRVYVLDQRMGVAPVGVVGELYIGGDGLARGYLNQAELTAEKFVPDPFSRRGGERLYRSGDLVRWRAGQGGTGELEFIGRVDAQVKVRGFRIELGEIEVALAAHPAVRDCVVCARQETPTHKRLVAYLVRDAEHGDGLTAAECKTYLQARLPEYMIPSAFVFVEELPLTAHGKVDRRALAALALGERERGYVAARTPIEQRLCRIWANVLGVERVGIEDNFFELGGDSILSIQVCARAKQAGLQLTPKLLFQHKTIAQLAPQVSLAAVGEAAQQTAVMGRLPLTPIQEWFFAQSLSNPHHFNQSLLLELRQPLEPVRLREAVARVVEHHDALRLRFRPSGEGWEQEMVGFEPQELPLTRLDLSALGEAAQSVAIEEACDRLQASLDISTGPLLRVAQLELGETGGSRLFIVIHHLAVDGVSWRVLVEDLLSAYGQLAGGGEVRLPAKTTSFLEWAQRLAAYAETEQVRAQAEYWQSQTRDGGVRLPVDEEGGQNTVASGRAVTAKLSAWETRALLQEVPPVYRTQINDVLMTALVEVLGRWSGSQRVLLDLEGHGRAEVLAGADVTRTVGWFTTIYPVALEVRVGAEVGEALKGVKEQLRRVPEAGVGYGLLRWKGGDEELRGKLSAAARAEVSFNYLGQFDQTLGAATGEVALASERTGRARREAGEREYVLEVVGKVMGGELQVTWMYSAQLHKEQTVRRLAQEYVEELQRIIRHCGSEDAGGYTPSDFPQANLNQDTLDKLIARLSRKEGEVAL